MRTSQDSKRRTHPETHTHTPPLSACLQLSGPHFEGFDQKLQTVSLTLCDHVIYSLDNAPLWSSVELCTVDQCACLYLQSVLACLRLFALMSLLALCVLLWISQVFPRVVHPGDAGWVAPPAVCVWHGHAEGNRQHGAVPAHHHAPGGTQPELQVSGPTWMAPFRNRIIRQVCLVLPEVTQGVYKVLSKAAFFYL